MSDTTPAVLMFQEIKRVEADISALLCGAGVAAEEGCQVFTVQLFCCLDYPFGEVVLCVHAGYEEDGGGFGFSIWHGAGSRDVHPGSNTKELPHIVAALPEALRVANGLAAHARRRLAERPTMPGGAA
jgi:hypothetical protein